MVARDGDGAQARNLPLPPLEPGDALERGRAARAVERRAFRRREEAVADDPPTTEEWRLLHALHEAQRDPAFRGARARDLVTETWERTYPEQENLSQIIFGGYIMRRAYELASICADGIATHRPVIGAVNRINFFRPVQIGDKLHLTARVVYTSGPAMCVETEIVQVSRDRTRQALSNSCLFTFVNADPALVSHQVPEVFPADFSEDARWLAARRNLQSLLARTRRGWFATASPSPPERG